MNGQVPSQPSSVGRRVTAAPDVVPFIHRPPPDRDYTRIAGVREATKDKLVAKLQAWFADHPEAEPLIYRRGCSLDTLSIDGLRILDADTARWTPPPVEPVDVEPVGAEQRSGG